MKTIMHVVGARPNYVKASPVINEIKSLEKYNQVVLNTGQHFDSVMTTEMMKCLSMDTPDINLKLDGEDLFSRLSDMICGIALHIKKENPNLVLVYGDVDSTLAASIVCSRMGVTFAHVESGLRSFDNSMPEELNRIIVDRLAQIHFVTEKDGIKNLNEENASKGEVHLVGNTMIDSLSKIMRENDIEVTSESSNKILLTCHRSSNVDTEKGLHKILKMCKDIHHDIIWPMHPRTKFRMREFDILDEFEGVENLHIVEPMNYKKFIKNVASSRVVITDSGGIQEETSYMGIPCLTIRDNTERPVTVSEGTNTLVSFDMVVDYINKIFDDKYKDGCKIKLWDGRSSIRIAEIIDRYMSRC